MEQEKKRLFESYLWFKTKFTTKLFFASILQFYQTHNLLQPDKTTFGIALFNNTQQVSASQIAEKLVPWNIHHFKHQENILQRKKLNYFTTYWSSPLLPLWLNRVNFGLLGVAPETQNLSASWFSFPPGHKSYQATIIHIPLNMIHSLLTWMIGVCSNPKKFICEVKLSLLKKQKHSYITQLLSH